MITVNMYEVLGGKQSKKDNKVTRIQGQYLLSVYVLQVWLSTPIYSHFLGIMYLLPFCWQHYYDNITLLLFNCFLVQGQSKHSINKYNYILLLGNLYKL